MHQGIQQAGFILFLLFVCFLAQALKEAGIPTFGLMHSMIIYAVFETSYGSIRVGATIILTALMGSLFGATLVFYLARSNSTRWLRYLPHFNPSRSVKAAKILARSSFAAVTFSRLLPGMMLPVSLLAGTLKLPFRRFITGVLIQLTIWVLFFFFLGNAAWQALPVPVLDVSFILHWLIAASLTITGIAIIIMLAKNRISINTVSAD